MARIKTHGLLCVVLAMSLLSCRPEVPFQYVLQVSVVDENGLPVDEISLSLRNNKTGRSDYRYESQGVGYYEFSGLTEMGSYQLWVHDRDDAYKDDFTNISLEEDKIVLISFKLRNI